MRMTRSDRRFLGLLLVVLSLALYVGLSIRLELGNPFNFIGGTQLRAFLPVFVFFVVMGDLLWLVPLKKEANEKVEGEKEKVEGERTEVEGGKDEVEGENAEVEGGRAEVEGGEVGEKTDLSSGALGEYLFLKAQGVPHQVVPDYDTDGLYLDILREAANKGYGPAAAKLGEYAMRRAVWIEAYYWMSMASRMGMENLTNVMREIRMNWVLAGHPDEEDNVNPLFPLETGSIGRALLHLDSGYRASDAREFLKTYYPEYL